MKGFRLVAEMLLRYPGAGLCAEGRSHDFEAWFSGFLVYVKIGIPSGLGLVKLLQVSLPKWEIS